MTLLSPRNRMQPTHIKISPGIKLVRVNAFEQSIYELCGRKYLSQETIINIQNKPTTILGIFLRPAFYFGGWILSEFRWNSQSWA
jgi:hypothetical protein